MGGQHRPCFDQPSHLDYNPPYCTGTLLTGSQTRNGDRMSNAMVLWAVDSNAVLRVNSEFGEQIGFSSNELVAQPFLDWIHIEDRGGIEHHLATGHGLVEARHRSKDGTWVSFEWLFKTHAG